MSDITEVKTAIDGIGRAFEELKATNEAKIKAEVKGAVDPLIEEKMERINDEMDKLSELKQAIERDANRTYKAANDDNENVEHKAYDKAFDLFVRKGVEPNMAEFKALSVNNDPDGGFLVAPTVSSRIIQHIFNKSSIRQLASVQTISTDSLDVMLDLQELSAGWVSETQARPDTTNPQLGKANIPTHEIYAQPKVTQKLLDDAAVNIETWLSAKVADKFARVESASFVNGDGVGKPRGFLNYANGTGSRQIENVPSGASGNLTADGVLSLLYALKEEYARNSTFLLNRAIMLRVRLLKESTTNAYIWQPDSLAGRPIAADDFMPTAITNGTKSIAIADWREAYQIVDRVGIRTLRDPYTEKPFVKFYTTKRVGGDVVNFQAIKVMTIGAS